MIPIPMILGLVYFVFRSLLLGAVDFERVGARLGRSS